MRLVSNVIVVFYSFLLLTNCTQANEPQISRAGTNSAIETTRVVSDVDEACLAEAIYFEAGLTPEARAAVAHVILNRSRDQRFPKSVCGVIRDGCQFSYRCSGKPLTLKDPRKRDGAYSAAEAVLTGAPDITNGALFFHAASVSPGWFKTRPRIGEFGGNIFYR